MNPLLGMSAKAWINQADATEIANVLFEYGEERFSRRIAVSIVRAREIAPIETTLQLANIIEKAHPKKDKHKHPATRSFQAIRIFINDELAAIEQCLPQVLTVLKVGGRMCVISFHSLEDRIVKKFIQHESVGREYPPHFPIPQQTLRLKKIGKRIEASLDEILKNPRARSARLRVAEKI